MATSAGEVILSALFAESPFEGAAAFTLGSGLRQIASRNSGTGTWRFVVVEKVSSSSSESVYFEHNGGEAGGGAISITPDTAITLPTGRCNIDFFGGDHESLHIEWSYDGDDSPTSYELSFDYGATWTSIGLPSELEHDITTGITPETLYRVKIRARNADGPGEWSDAASFTTPAAPVGAVIPVDHESAYSSGTSASLSITVSGSDTAVIVAVGARDEGYQEFVCTLNGTPMTVLGGNPHNPLHYKLCQLTGLSPGTYTVAASVSGDAPGGIAILAISVESWNSSRTPAISYSGSSTLGSHSSITAQPGDLVVGMCFRYGASSDATSADLDILETAGSSDIRGTLGIMTADASPESITWSGTGSSERVYMAISLQPGAGSAGGDPPEGAVDFDAAVGHDSLALRNITYSGSDTDSQGFRFQYRLNGGSWANASAPYLINSQTPGSYVTVQMRAANDYGPGAASASKTFRLHYDWHRTGIKRFHPSAAVGHVIVGKEPTPYASRSGPLTTGGNDAAVIVSNDVVYSQPNGATVTPHSVTYDGDPLTKIYSWVSPGNRMGTGFYGGHEVFALAGPQSGTNTLEITADNGGSITEHSFWLGAAAFCNVDQASPVAAVVAKYEGETRDSVYEPLSPDRVGAITNIPCSLDEYVVGHLGNYPNHGGTINEDISGATQTNLLGEVGGWTQDANPVNEIGFATVIDHEPICSGGTMAQCHVQLDGATEAGSPLGVMQWKWSFGAGSDIAGYLTRAAIVLKPSPNMLRNLSAGASAWSAVSDCNHGRALVVVTPAEDPAPTSEQIREIVDEETTDYAGSVLYSDAIDITAEGTVGDAITGIVGQTEPPRISVVYESWQGNLGDPLETEIQPQVVLAPASPAHLQAASSVLITQAHLITPASAAHGQSATAAEITQDHLIETENVAHEQAAPSVTIEQVHIIEPGSSVHVQEASAATVSVEVTIEPDSAAHQQQGQSASISQDHHIAPASPAHAHTAQAVTIDQAHVIEAESAEHAQAATAAELTTGAIVEPASAEHAQAAGSVGMIEDSTVAPAAAIHAQTTSDAEIEQAHMIAPEAALHGQFATLATVAVTEIISPDLAIHGHEATDAQVEHGHLVIPLPADHSQVTSNPAFTQDHKIAPLDAVHISISTDTVVRIMEYADFVPGVQRALYVRARPVVWFMRPNRWGVMVSDILEMRPGENDLFDIHCGPVMRSGAVIAGVEEITIAGPDEDLEMVGLPSFDGQIIQVRLRHTDPALAEIREYRISAKFSYDSDDGATSARQVDGWVRVKPLIN